MFVRNRLVRVLSASFCLIVLGAQSCLAEKLTPPKTWWPDPSTGLMWTGRTPERPGIPLPIMEWKDAEKYCTSLQLGGYSGWRLPTVDELKAITYMQHFDAQPSQLGQCSSFSRDQCTFGPWPAMDALEFKGGITVPAPLSVWSSTMNGNDQAFVVTPVGNWGIGWVHDSASGVYSMKMTKSESNLFSGDTPRLDGSVLCARPMEADLLQIAKDAQANHPVPDVLTLKAYVPLNKARLAYQAGQFEESIAQAKNAFLIKPKFAPAYWAIGISYGRLGQWDLAITNLEAALKIDKGYGDAKDALKWAKDSQKAAKTGGRIKAQSPEWN